MTKSVVPEGKIKTAVKKYYAERIESGSGCCDTSCCSDGSEHARKIGYEEEALSTLPKQAVESAFGCGNPLAFAAVKRGETIIDIGSGAGIDCFIAAEKVGEHGKVIGIDMTPEMLNRANINAREKGYEQVQFLYGEAEKLPLGDHLADWVISNCVINLSPNKTAVFDEMYRVLKPGGRFSISDIVLGMNMPEELKENLTAWSGCISGAITEEAYLEGLSLAGFEAVSVSERLIYSDEEMLALAGDLGIQLTGEAGEKLARQFSGQVWSARIHGRKPTSSDS